MRNTIINFLAFSILALIILAFTTFPSGEEVYSSSLLSTPYVIIAWGDSRNYFKSEFDIYYTDSLDGAITWKEAKKFTRDAKRDNLPSIAVDGSHIIIAYQNNIGGDWDIFYKESKNLGNSWDEKRLTFMATDENRPAVTLLGNHIIIAYSSLRGGNRDIYYMESFDGGATWEEERLTTESGSQMHPCIARDGNRIIIAYVDIPNRRLCYKESYDGGLYWSADETIQPDKSNDCMDVSIFMPAIALDGNHIIVAWEDNSRRGEGKAWWIYYRESYDGGATWSGEKMLTSLTRGLFAQNGSAVAINGNEIIFAWCDDEEYYIYNVSIYYKFSTDGGTTWSNDIRLTNEICYQSRPAVAINK